MGFAAYFRLIRAGYVLAREGALSLVDPAPLPAGPAFAIRLGRLIERRSVRRSGRAERLSAALNRLGPTYVKFGQTLSTRPDIVGAALAEDLSVLQDSMAPFDSALVPAILTQSLGRRAVDLVDLGPAIAAASIAQVHRATLLSGGTRRQVAVKVLRPGIARRFFADLESFAAAARLAERFVPATRRLRPIDVVETLRQSAKLELDLTLEAASISAFAGNIAADEGFHAPLVHWEHTAADVLTTDWIEGIAIGDLAALDAAGLDRRQLASRLLQSFLKHAVRDGFFHADMHPGNLFADPRTGAIVAVDFGIMGRLTRRERRFLAEVIHGFITRNYLRIAQLHFEIGYVPADQSMEDFALALRAIGEPMVGRAASAISMANVLSKLFLTTDRFSMRTRPELVLLQKNMVLVEGVARRLDPELDLWTIAEPVVGDWVRREAGPLGRLEALAEEGSALLLAARRLPAIAAEAEALLVEARADMAARRARHRDWLTPILGGLALLAVALVIVVLWRLLGLGHA